MRTLNYILFALSVIWPADRYSLRAQIYTAKGGSFIVFQDTPDKTSAVNFATPGINNHTYKWPSNENDFIRAYREAEVIIVGPIVLTDDDLRKMWNTLEGMSVMAPSMQFHPTMLLALGQAAYIQGKTPLTSCLISLRIPKAPDATKTIEWRDHISKATSHAKAETVKDNGRNIQLKFLFPNESWIKGATVFKQTVGSKESTKIFPLLFTSVLADRIEMNIRDTMNQVGEFLYIVQPYDHFGNTFPDLPAVYANNYNQWSAPAILDFRCEAMKESKTIRLAWDCSIRERVRGFEIYRGMESSGPFMKIASLPVSDSIYSDHVEGVMQNFFYYVQILDQLGKGAKSITRFATPLVKEKPQPPMDLNAYPAKEGVLLTWPTLDGLYHTRGYYVYRREQDTSSWIQVSEFIPISGSVMSYTDTSHLLQTEHEYAYRVRSESTSYLLSDPSVVAISRPDLPRDVVTPQDVSWRYLDEGQLMLHWSDQRIHDPYILKYHIYSVNSEGLPDKELQGSPVGVNQNFWIQSDVPAQKIGYCVKAEDAWGNQSVCSHIVSPFHSETIPAPGLILIHPHTNGYRLSWGLPEDDEIQSILLYELNDKNAGVLVKSFTPQTGTFDIPKLKDNQVRTFYLVYKTTDGKQSDAGESVVISR